MRITDVYYCTPTNSINPRQSSFYKVVCLILFIQENCANNNN